MSLTVMKKKMVRKELKLEALAYLQAVVKNAQYRRYQEGWIPKVEGIMVPHPIRLPSPMLERSPWRTALVTPKGVHWGPDDWLNIDQVRAKIRMEHFPLPKGGYMYELPACLDADDNDSRWKTWRP